MPGFDGQELLRARGASPGGANVPFLFLTASESQDRTLPLLEHGACDALAKPFDPGELVARLGLHLRIKKLQDELQCKNETLERLSATDALTGLATRRYVDEVLSIELMRARRYGAPLCVLMADLDHFKQVNDQYGRLAGDAVLRETALLLRAQLRATDSGGRYGGEEFLVVLSHNSAKGAAIVADRWRQSLEESRIEIPDGRRISATLSIGVAEYGANGKTSEALIAAADQALYRAKDSGRNRVVVAGLERLDSVF
jgi:diguanylate cyclase (GGDEF)-like protein